MKDKTENTSFKNLIKDKKKKNKLSINQVDSSTEGDLKVSENTTDKPAADNLTHRPLNETIHIS